ncbi:dipeptide epimerase [Streptomyces platensis]|uniref:dipeptide epimerase n=1 Tax=Streptomyces platensis TaxID=58346 RepID=UPI002E26D42E|nr:dipeptide epimerase [Streptomyces platensis]WUB85089.1 dipeptide epimerase [Streptomyces platensis]
MIIHEVRLPLRHAFTTAHGTADVQQSIIVELTDGDLSGFGEAVCIPHEGWLAPGIRTALESNRAAIEAHALEDPEEFWEACFPLMADHRCALSALDQAAHDLWGKREGAPVRELWGLPQGPLPTSSYTIGLDDTHRMVSKMLEFEGWPVFKIKLGAGRDLEIVRSLRRYTAATFRVDANCAWNVEDALTYAPYLAELGVEFIEQPLPRDARRDQVRLHDEAGILLMADESCATENDIERCAEGFDAINIKLAKCGGLTPARRMIERARRHGLRVMVGCMTETTVGISAISQLLPLVDYADIDGSVLVARDVADGVRLHRGRPVLPDTPGTGVTWRGTPA